MLRKLIKNQYGAAAVEMALVTPFLMLLMFGSFELGKYFWDNHIITKAVRDGARYASRQPFSNFDCDAETVAAGVVSNTQNLTRTNTLDGTGAVRLGGWTNTMIDVEVACDNSGAYTSIYSGMDVPVVSVTADVPYRSLFGSFGFTDATFQLRARSEAPVMGI
jgi:Flp pilus assembly protein TadG